MKKKKTNLKKTKQRLNKREDLNLEVRGLPVDSPSPRLPEDLEHAFYTVGRHAKEWFTAR
jgi:hypothetical protein